ncbi:MULTISPECIES: S1 family peptidase [Acinetobacter]|uniref:S1 family peptidase n=1 Tax=Acinetobacter TaxID=469 RepID=UPI00192C193F|nr:MULTISPECIES: trypsin-like serine protease [Acinetobacter]MCU4423247.1 hypothetical protein [Acinetobacter sp. WU_MDCI_Abxb74]
MTKLSSLKRKLLASILIGISLTSLTHAAATVDYLQKKYNISSDEANRRVDLQNDVIALSEKLNQANDPNYADMYIQHQPVYKIIVLFADNSDRKDFLKSLDPKLQRWVQIKQAKKSRNVYSKELDDINISLNRLNIIYTSVYDLESQKFLITVEKKSDVNLVKQILPKARNGEVTVRVGNVPKIEAAPSGVKAGDKLYAGNTLSFTSGSPGCTAGFAVSYISGGVTKKGVLTSGHCPNDMLVKFNDHNVLLSGPIIEKQHRSDPSGGGDNISDKYDYQIWDGTGLNLDNQIAFKDLNGIPEFPATGIFRLTAITTFLNQKKGMIVCKSGQTTGITCGEITNGNASHDGVAGWIQVANSNQANISAGGDSGGPWFLYPGSSTNVNGVGVHTAGNSSTNPDDYAIYMPIDYIDDHISSVNTLKQ